MLVLKHLHDYKATFHKVQFRMGGDFSVLKNTSAYCNLPFKTYCNNSQDLFSCVDALHDDDILHEITVGCTQICLGCKEGQLGENVTKACILLVVFAERLVFLSVTLHHKPQSSQPVRQQTADSRQQTSSFLPTVFMLACCILEKNIWKMLENSKLWVLNL